MPLTPYEDTISEQPKIVLPAVPKHCMWLPDVIIGQTSKGEYLQNAVQATNPYQRQDLETPIDQTVTAYVVTVKPKEGKLLIEKCMALGVPPGPLLGELKAGRDIILDTGVKVRSTDVLEEESPPLSYIVVECPSHDYLPSLKANERLASNHEDINTSIQAIFHFSPSEVINSEIYKTWMNSFDPRVKHIFLNDCNDSYGSHGLQGIKK